MKPPDLAAANGRIEFLQTGQAVVIPAGYIIFHASKGLLPEAFLPTQMSKDSLSDGCSLYAPCLFFVGRRVDRF